jgi:CrcB protein
MGRSFGNLRRAPQRTGTTDMARLLLICLGSGLGGGARYLLSAFILRALGPAFPFGTLTVNVIGSYLLAVVMYAGMETSLFSTTVRLALATGVLGGFTTYSTFSYETLRYLQTGAHYTALVNVAATVVVCLLACWLGWVSARWILG